MQGGSAMRRVRSDRSHSAGFFFARAPPVLSSVCSRVKEVRLEGRHRIAFTTSRPRSMLVLVGITSIPGIEVTSEVVFIGPYGHVRRSLHGVLALLRCLIRTRVDMLIQSTFSLVLTHTWFLSTKLHVRETQNASCQKRTFNSTLGHRRPLCLGVLGRCPAHSRLLR
ncbi:hypothetical protein F4780DRAFT_326725 [Xylariomycetidae sp. FL0641]|nr:hypothetical protein F4780DRAFT_326725 [Xylariomycetidae sp. FL0641]